MKSLTIAGLSVLLLALFFQCCPSGPAEGPAPTPEADEIPTVPANTPTPPAEVWTLIAPEGRGHALFTEDCLTDESCPDCLLGELPAGTRMEPAGGGCHVTTWDASYSYCNVLVLDGELAGTYGWVNEKFIQK